MQRDGLERESSLLPLTLTRVSSRAEPTISLCEDIAAYREATVNVNTGPLMLSQYVNDAITFERCIFRENTFFK